MNKFVCIQKCFCNSILEVENSDINVLLNFYDSNLIYYYRCPVCNKMNMISENILPRNLKLDKLLKVKNSLCRKTII